MRPARQTKTCNSEDCKLNKDQKKQIDSESDNVKEKVKSNSNNPDDTNC